MTIRPCDINAQQHFWDAFGNHENEVSAGWLVRWLQEHSPDAWVPISADAINQEHRTKHPGMDFRINGLEQGGWVKRTRDHWVVTADFIFRCYRSSPARDVLEAPDAR